MSDSESDELLMDRLGHGDESALDELMRRWQGSLWCFIDRLCGRLGCSDDVHQEVWTRLFVYRTRFRPSMRFRSYLFAVAVNCCRTALARGTIRRQADRALEAPASGGAGGGPSALDEMIASERRDLLHRAIAQLPPAQRAVALLYVLMDSDYKQIAMTLGKSPGTVRSLMHHALRRLRSKLERMTEYAEGQVRHERRDDGQAR